MVTKVLNLAIFTFLTNKACFSNPTYILEKIALIDDECLSTHILDSRSTILFFDLHTQNEHSRTHRYIPAADHH